MAHKNIYIVTEEDTACRDPLGVFDRKGLLKFLKEQKRKARWEYHYEVDEKGHKKFIKRMKVYPQLKVVAHSLNKIDPGMVYYPWYLIR